jgi:hypothetical protein
VINVVCVNQERIIQRHTQHWSQENRRGNQET